MYDLDRNLTSDGKYTYEWKAFDQLTKVKSNTGTIVAEYGYDEKGRRIYSKDSNGPIYYAYDGDSNRILYEKDKSSYAVKSYVYDDNGHPLTMIYKGETYHYLTNYRGDVLGMTDASGKLVASYTYDAWGNILTQSGTDDMDSINPYRYAGYRYDEDTKLYYLMARYYNPDTGVFLSLDPMRGDTMNPLTLNGYNYANNNPIINIDPYGEYWKNAWWNKKGFLSKTINAVIFLAAAAVGGSATKILGSYAKKQLSKAKRIVFANSIKKH